MREEGQVDRTGQLLCSTCNIVVCMHRCIFYCCTVFVHFCIVRAVACSVFMSFARTSVHTWILLVTIVEGFGRRKFVNHVVVPSSGVYVCIEGPEHCSVKTHPSEFHAGNYICMLTSHPLASFSKYRIEQNRLIINLATHPELTKGPVNIAWFPSQDCVQQHKLSRRDTPRLKVDSPVLYWRLSSLKNSNK